MEEARRTVTRSHGPEQDGRRGTRGGPSARNLLMEAQSDILDGEELEMLVLSRRTGEQIVIADGIVVQVLSVRGDVVKLGITAPKDVSVHRREVYEAIQKELQDGLRAKEARR